MKEAVACCVRLTFSPKTKVMRPHCARPGNQPGSWRLQWGRIRGGQRAMMMHPKDEEGLQRLGRPELLPYPESTYPRRDSRGRLCSVGARSHLPSTSPLPWHCHTAFQGLLGKTERRQGFLVRCHGPMVGIGALSPPWHVPRPLRLPRGAPGAAPRAQPLPCPGCCCEDSALRSPVRVRRWHQ